MDRTTPLVAIPAKTRSNRAAALPLGEELLVPVEVTVPAHYRPQGPGNVLIDLTKAVRKHTTVHGHCA